MKFNSSVAVLAMAAALLAGCGGGGGSASPPPVAVTPPPPAPPPPPPPPPPPATTSEHEVGPAQTSAEISAIPTPHLTVAPASTTAKARLFVMLPGTGGTSRQYQLIVRRGAARGYHSIGLAYPNAEAVELLCGTNSGTACVGLARREVITGEAVSPVVSVNPANSITGRLTALLIYLSTTYPNEGWGQFLLGGRVNWALVTVGGHSQGAGHAAYLGKLQLLDRVAMFAGPADFGSSVFTNADWLNQPNLTPAARQFGFTHMDDSIVPPFRSTANWVLLGLGAFGAAASVDNASAPYSGSHQLTTSMILQNDPSRPADQLAHGAPVTDHFTPLTASGAPVFGPVWDYMAFP